ncbi:MAG: ABC transporter [Planctomycetes bacterium]|jgi:ABC-type uncharacterized transport system involved in gliding motility auxiliary subunit|nr:ABC transporter [Planctomycetota bacterium]
MKHAFTLTVGALLALVLFLAVNVLANTSLRSVRGDMTQDGLYTLTEGSRAIAANQEEELTLYFYFSKDIGRELPQVAEYAQRVRNLLKEYVRASPGKITLIEINPEPFSEEEDRAVQEGVQGVRIGSGEQLYFGLVGTNETGDREVHPFFEPSPSKERFLEYDLSRLIWTLAHPNKKRLGILSAIELVGGPPPQANPFQEQPPSEAWQILDELRQYFDVEVLDAASGEISNDLDMLCVVHPRGFSDPALYAIDQWALQGKPLMVFVDPYCEIDPGDVPPGTNPQFARFQAEKGSDLEKLFGAWGIELANQKFVGDRTRALRATVGQEVLPIVYFLGMGEEDFAEKDPVMSTLKTMRFSVAGALRATPDATTSFQPLVQTTEDASELDVGRIKFPNYSEMFTNFVPGYEKLTLAARVTGDVKTAFPDGNPSAPEVAEGEAEQSSVDGDHLAASVAPLNAIVVADADMLADHHWIQIQRIPGTGMALRRMVSENADFLVSSLENLLGGSELTSIRARGEHSRPFGRVDEIRREAEQHFLAEEQELDRRLRDIQSRLDELEGERGDANGELVTAAQREEIRRARGEQLETRKKLRDVKHNLRKDVEALGTRLKWANILAMPALVLCSMGFFLTRNRKRS